MYSVLIVDDENWVVESLKASIDWKSIGYEIAGQSYDGIDALKKIKEIQPDIVFTDIKMPGISGLELIKRASEISSNTKFIIISGFAEFAFVQKAINYGAVGYCLKPFDEGEITSLLHKIKNTSIIQNKTTYNIYDILSNKNNGKDLSVKGIIKEYSLNLNYENELLLIVSLGNGTLNIPFGINVHNLYSGSGKKIFLIESNELIKKHLVVEKISVDSFYGIGLKYINDPDIKFIDALDEAESAAYSYFITGNFGFFQYSKEDDYVFTKFIIKLEEALKNKDIPEIIEIFKNISIEFEHLIFGIKYAINLYNSTMYFIKKYLDENIDDFIFNYEFIVTKFTNFKMMLESLFNIISNAISQNNNLITPEIDNNTFKLLLKYINEKFYVDLSLYDLSEKYHLNQNYITQLFKKYLKIPYTEYVAQLRIKYACVMLEKTDHHIKDISIKAGYPDYFYFCRIFKKITGLTPTQFRDANKK